MTVPTPPDRLDRLRLAAWRPYLHLLARADESGPAYAARMATTDLADVPPFVRDVIDGLLGLLDACRLAKATGVPLGELRGTPERN